MQLMALILKMALNFPITHKNQYAVYTNIVIYNI